MSKPEIQWGDACFLFPFKPRIDSTNRPEGVDLVVQTILHLHMDHLDLWRQVFLCLWGQYVSENFQKICVSKPGTWRGDGWLWFFLKSRFDFTFGPEGVDLVVETILDVICHHTSPFGTIVCVCGVNICQKKFKKYESPSQEYDKAIDGLRVSWNQELTLQFDPKGSTLSSRPFSTSTWSTFRVKCFCVCGVNVGLKIFKKYLFPSLRHDEAMGGFDDSWN